MPEKQFVRAKPLRQAKQRQEYKPRENKKNYSKKYQEKNMIKQTTRQPVKYMLSTFKFFSKSKKIDKIIKQHPKFFSEQARKPGQDIANNFNDYLYVVAKKQIILKHSKPQESESQQPEWNSDSDKEIKLQSKKIDDEIVKKVNQNPKITKKTGELQYHERVFLQEYYLSKNNQQQKENTQNNQKQNQHLNQKKTKQIQQSIQNHSKNDSDPVWAQYAVNALLDKGVIQKMDENDQNINDFDDDDFSYEEEKSQDKSSSSSDDDMFTDEGPRTKIIVMDKNQQKIQVQKPKEIVRINDHFFTKIAEQIGVNPQTCTWIISNKSGKFKVSTFYMNEYYHVSKLDLQFPYISLNNSSFVHNDDLKAGKSIQILKKKDETVRGNNKNKKYPHYKQKK